MYSTTNLAEARKNLPELADRAYAGQTFVLSRRGRELAVIMGIDEYRRLVELEREQRKKDFDILLAPPDPSAMSEEEAQELAIQAIHEVRATRRAKQ